MYNIKGPSKIVAKTTRRGISQNIDNYRDYNKNKVTENDDEDVKNVPKPVFHKKTSPNNNRQELISPQHEEIIKFIDESWSSVCSELEQDPQDLESPQDQLVYYYEDEPNDKLQNFKPFDLESWWGKRLYAYITSSVNVKN